MMHIASTQRFKKRLIVPLIKVFPGRFVEILRARRRKKRRTKGSSK